MWNEWGVEKPDDGGGGGERRVCTRFQSLWPPPHGSVLFMLHGAEPDGNGLQLSGSHWQPSGGEAELGTPLADYRAGGGDEWTSGRFYLVLVHATILLG